MKDLVNLFHKYKVKYALVGGFAVNFYGYVRTTLDIDFLLYPSEENATKILSALQEFGFGAKEISKKFFKEPGNVLHLGVEPNRIDLLTHVVGLSNDEIFSNLQKIEIAKIKINIISIDDLIKIKQSSNRLRDKADAEELEKIRSK